MLSDSTPQIFVEFVLHTSQVNAAIVAPHVDRNSTYEATNDSRTIFIGVITPGVDVIKV